MEDTIRLVCQKCPSLRSKDPKLNKTGKQDFRLRPMLSTWKKEDSPPSRVKPIPMIILLRAAELAEKFARDQATIDCIWMTFYFLLCPGECANASGEAKHPFHLEDVECKIGHKHIFDVHLAFVAQLLAATFISLTFTDQKNGIKGEIFLMSPMGNPLLTQCVPSPAASFISSDTMLHSTHPFTLTTMNLDGVVPFRPQ